jgi:trehalose 6-phosphate synthase/phosphatase
MNLVCYEFVACQQQENAGVLVLSEFAGAAQSLGSGAILVNPWSVTDMAGAIEDSLTMPAEDRQERHRQNFVHVTVHTAQAWADTFISELNDTHIEAALRTKKSPTPLKSDELLSSFVSSKKRLLVLGFNASLASSSFESSSNLFAKASSTSNGNTGKGLKAPLVVDEHVRKALQALCNDGRTEVAVISGQERASLDAAFAGVAHRLHMAAENGVFVKPAGQTSWVVTTDLSQHQWLVSVQLVFDYFAERTPRSFVETREASIVWNYRRSDPGFGRLQARDLLQHLITGPISTSHVDVVQGSNSVEVRPAGVSKGAALEQLLQAQDLSEIDYDFIMCGGHFLSRDEDLFSCVQGRSGSLTSDRGWRPQPNANASNQARGISSANDDTRAARGPMVYTITIGRKQSRARSFVPDCERMADLLWTLSKSAASTSSSDLRSSSHCIVDGPRSPP